VFTPKRTGMMLVPKPLSQTDDGLFSNTWPRSVTLTIAADFDTLPRFNGNQTCPRVRGRLIAT
jgi:hypothetical protein